MINEKIRMNKYAGRIHSLLGGLGVQVVYDEDEDLVYAFSESPFGNVYCIYTLEGGVMSSYAIYEYAVADSSMPEVLSCLEDLNQISEAGCFYIDDPRSCVAYGLHYPISQGDNTDSFTHFIMHWYGRYNQCRPILYMLTAGKLTEEDSLPVCIDNNEQPEHAEYFKNKQSNTV